MLVNEYDYEHVLTRGSWTIFRFYLMVQPWTREFSTVEYFPIQTMVWVLISGFPYHYYSKLFQYTCWRSCRFVRLVVMVDLKKPLVSGVRTNGVFFDLEYEGLQRVFLKCGLYGHAMEMCKEFYNRGIGYGDVRTCGSGLDVDVSCPANFETTYGP
ncbi:hypothetical protein GQ457_03G015290 [Hibiscus cannabinus]